MTWIDVSVPLRSGMVHWPGDPAVSIELVAAMARGDDADVTALNIGAHTGTHMDAPSHFVPGAASLDALSPLGVLKRGYSLTKRLSDGQLVRDAGQLLPGDAISILLASGSVVSRVERVERDDE